MGRGQLARSFRPFCFRDNGRGVRRALQVSEHERCTTARCPECDGKQEILRNSESSTRGALGLWITRVPEGTARFYPVRTLMKCRKTKCERFRAVAGGINNWHHRNRNGLVVGRGAGRASAEGLMVVHPAQDAPEGLTVFGIGRGALRRIAPPTELVQEARW